MYELDRESTQADIVEAVELGHTSEQSDERLMRAKMMFTEGQGAQMPYRVAMILAGLEGPITCPEIMELTGANRQAVHKALRAVGKKAARAGLVLEVEGSHKGRHRKKYYLKEDKEAEIAAVPHKEAAPRNRPRSEIIAEYSGDLPLLKEVPDGAEGIVNNATYLSLSALELKVLHFILAEAKAGQAVRVSSMLSELGITATAYNRLRRNKINKNALYSGIYIHTSLRSEPYTAISFLEPSERHKQLKELEPGVDLSTCFEEAIEFDEALARKWLEAQILHAETREILTWIIEAQATGAPTSFASVSQIVRAKYGGFGCKKSKERRLASVVEPLEKIYAGRAFRGGYVRKNRYQRLELILLRRPDLKQGEVNLVIEEELELFRFARSFGTYRAAARERLLNGHVGLVKSIAVQFSKAIEFEEKLAVGMEAVARGLDGFDPSRGIKFKDYIYPGIRRAIADEIRKSRIVYKGQYATKSVSIRGEVEDDLRRKGLAEAEITDKAVADRWGISVDEARKIRCNGEIGAYSCTREDGSEQQFSAPAATERALFGYEQRRVRKALQVFLSQFPERNRIVFQERFWGEVGQGELATRFGVSKSTVNNWQHVVIKAMREDPVISQMAAEIFKS